MLDNFIQQRADILFDNGYLGLAWSLIYLGQLLVWVFQTALPVAGSVCLALLADSFFRQKTSMLYWKKFRNNPRQVFEKCIGHTFVKTGVRILLALTSVMLLLLGAMAALLTIAPPEGGHVRHMLTHPNIMQAIGYLAVFTCFAAYLKFSFYHCAGLIKSPGQFNLKMLIW